MRRIPHASWPVLLVLAVAAPLRLARSRLERVSGRRGPRRPPGDGRAPGSRRRPRGPPQGARRDPADLPVRRQPRADRRRQSPGCRSHWPASGPSSRSTAWRARSLAARPRSSPACCSPSTATSWRSDASSSTTAWPSSWASAGCCAAGGSGRPLTISGRMPRPPPLATAAARLGVPRRAAPLRRGAGCARRRLPGPARPSCWPGPAWSGTPDRGAAPLLAGASRLGLADRARAARRLAGAGRRRPRRRARAASGRTSARASAASGRTGTAALLLSANHYLSTPYLADDAAGWRRRACVLGLVRVARALGGRGVVIRLGLAILLAALTWDRPRAAFALGAVLVLRAGGPGALAAPRASPRDARRAGLGGRPAVRPPAPDPGARHPLARGVPRPDPGARGAGRAGPGPSLGRVSSAARCWPR